MYWIWITCIVFVVGCEHEEADRRLKSGKLTWELSDTLDVAISDTLFFHSGKNWLTFEDVPEDSRCPVNAQCVWAGDAVADLRYFDGDITHELVLHTHPNYSTDTIIGGFYVELVDVWPHPYAGKSVDHSDYKATLFVTDDTSELDKTGYMGTVVNYTGLDGCGYVIELDNGKKLEPAEYPEHFQFYDGQRVSLTYKVRNDLMSTCMVGEIVEITEIENTGCPLYSVMPFGQKIDELPSDPLIIQSITLENGCLKIKLGYSGGCEKHELDMVQMPLLCATPPLPQPIFYLVHDSNGDRCEAFITEELTFDLKPLKNHYPNGTKFTVMTPDNSYSKEFQITF